MDAGHLVLARKYRPQKFSEVVKQQIAVKAMQNAIESGRLGSAYLFFGPRGVGKTTLARILAKRVNCTSPENGEPCDKCESCLSILQGNSLDVIEIDAASHRGIQNIRELRENVKFQPMAAKKKVYIIDEVHMLTTESFNALLKTLEEPPPFVLFVLATTEFNKIPETILSRCQVFALRKVPLKVVQDYLKTLCDSENIPAEDEALFWIARKGDGSVRDSLSFLEQAAVYTDRKITAEQVKDLIGAYPLDHFLDLLLALLNPDSDAPAMMKPVQEVFVTGGDLGRFVWEFCDFLRTAIHIKHGIEDTEFLGIPGSDIQKIRESTADVDSVRMTVIFDHIYELLTKAHTIRLRNSYENRILIEIELLSLREKLTRPSLSSVLTRLSRLSAAVSQGATYSPESELQKKFLGTVVDPSSIPDIGKQ